MCGRFRLEDNEAIRRLLEIVGVIGQPVFQPDIAPTKAISIIWQKDQREIVTANHWWLCLDRKTLKPVRNLKSFNSRSDRLFDDHTAASYRPFREGRCIIPATAFIEGHEANGTNHMIELEGCAVAFAGLYKEYLNKDTGDSAIGASFITLGSHSSWSNINPDSMPLMLDYRDKELIDHWLDPSFRNIETFRSLLEPRIMFDQRVTRIGKVSHWNPIDSPFLIRRDAA